MGIFDEFVQGVGREISKVQARSQEMLQAYNLNSQIRTLEGKKSALLIEIGRLIFEKYQRQMEISDERLKAKTEEIVDIEHQVTVLQAELDALKVQSDPNTTASQRAQYQAGYNPTPGFTCPHCQAPANVEKSFCPACGGCLQGKSDNGET
jgi:SMC interacting uncharacterized protein involved in chromosome segregation